MRHSDDKQSGAKYEVSIHAPVKVRRIIALWLFDTLAFQFTHPWRCDLRHGCLSCWLSGFNSRTREGATGLANKPTFWFVVSIHAPVKVRPLPKGKRLFYLCFNSRTREGATYITPSKINRALFQFTHPWRCDRWKRKCPCLVLCFNSRTREGATPKSILLVYHHLFQFTHPWRCDLRDIFASSFLQGFNSRTREGATMGGNINGRANVVSIHAPVKVRLFSFSFSIRYLLFQFTHPWRCDTCR